MRAVTFLFRVLIVLTVLLFAQTLYPARVAAQDPAAMWLNSQAAIPPLASDGIQMWKRADIRVVPIDLLVADKAELESLRQRVARADSDSMKLDLSDAAVREQVSRQLQLLRALLLLAERPYSEQGKSRAALGVQRHLNQIEGQRNCSACHAVGLAELR
jgi:hypothetical protein